MTAVAALVIQIVHTLYSYLMLTICEMTLNLYYLAHYICTLFPQQHYFSATYSTNFSFNLHPINCALVAGMASIRWWPTRPPSFCLLFP